jgi:dihydrolipoamide dehydrogenase
LSLPIPQIAIVGAGFAALSDKPLAIGEVSFEDQGAHASCCATAATCASYADPLTGRFLGAEMAGPDAEHIGHLLAWALQNRMTVAKMLEMPFYHPVIEEGLRTALRDLDVDVRHERHVAPKPIDEQYEPCPEASVAV